MATILARLAALDRAIETLNDRRHTEAAEIAVRADAYRGAVMDEKEHGRHWGFTGSLSIAETATPGMVRVWGQHRYRDGDTDGFSMVMPVDYLNGTMTLADAIAPVLAEQAEAKTLAAARIAATERGIYEALKAKFEGKTDGQD
jgi:hypothetical protein